MNQPLRDIASIADVDKKQADVVEDDTKQAAEKKKSPNTSTRAYFLRQNSPGKLTKKKGNSEKFRFITDLRALRSKIATYKSPAHKLSTALASLGTSRCSI
jgi:hypothetical protein